MELIMKLLKYELSKIFINKGFMVFFLICIIANCVLVLFTDKLNNYNLTSDQYSECFTYLFNMDDEESRWAFLKQRNQELSDIERLISINNRNLDSISTESYKKYENSIVNKSYLLFTEDISSEKRLNDYYYNQVNTTMNYKNRIQNIDKKASQMEEISIFSDQNSFSYKNIIKTSNDFKQLNLGELPFDNNIGMEMATNFSGTEILVIICAFQICAILITYEKEKGILPLINVNYKSKFPLAISKILALIITLTVTIVVLFGSNLLLAMMKYGLGDLYRPIQSVAICADIPINLNVISYLILYLLFKYISIVCVSLIIYLFCLLFRHSIAVFAFSFSFFALEVMLFNVSNIDIIKYINFVYFIFDSRFYRKYLNINVFGNPVNIVASFLLVAFVLIALLLVVNLYLYCRNNDCSAKKDLTSKINIKIVNTRLASHELYKSLICSKSIIIIFVVVLVQILIVAFAKPNLSTDDLYYKFYMKNLSGPVTGETVEFINEEKEKYDFYDSEMQEYTNKHNRGEISKTEYLGYQMDYNSKTYGRTVFQNIILDQYDYIKKYSDENDCVLWFVDDIGLGKLIAKNGYRDDRIDSILLLIIVTVCIASNYSLEYRWGTSKLIDSYYKGKGHTYLIKLLVSIIITIIAFIICYLPKILMVHNLYGIDGLNAPVQSLKMFEGFLYNISVIQYLILVYLTRLISICSITILILTISFLTESISKAIIISISILIGPIILSELGLNWIDYFSFNILLSSNQLYQTNNILSILIYFFLLLCITIFSIWLIFYKMYHYKIVKEEVTAELV